MPIARWEVILNKLISIILVLALLLGVSAMLFSCGGEIPDPAPDNGDQNNGDTGNQPGGQNPGPTVIVPPEKDYGRGTVDFSELGYRRPGIESIIESFKQVTAAIEKNDQPLSEQIDLIKSLEEGNTQVRTMYAIANIYNSKDSSSSFWSAEYEYINTNLPAFSKVIESLLVACARSEHKESFEEDYFEYSLDEYVDGGIYTDRVVELMEQEKALETKYSSFSTATVKITYNGKTGTVDELLAALLENYAENSTYYLSMKTVYETLYRQKVNELSRTIFVDLVKVRRLIADELGYDSYAEYAYDYLGHDYSEDDMESFLLDVKNYVLPVYLNLYNLVFGTFFTTTLSGTADKVEVINDLYALYSGMDAEIAEAYSYMLQHELYDIAPESANRFAGAFTTYINGNESPFIFMSSEGKVMDYATLSHEFGHFYDAFVNFNNNASLDLNEVSSQGLELMTMLYLEQHVLQNDYKYLQYYKLNSALETLIYQGFYAYFEQEVYRIEYDNISEETINDAVKKASLAIFGVDSYSDMYYVLIPHTILEPFYVQSYCTSVSSALEIFFIENEERGKGVSIYKDLVKVDGELSFTEELDVSGLSNPFGEAFLKEISDDIQYLILGYHYFTEAEGGNAA